MSEEERALTALSVHFNQKRCHRNLSRRNGHVEKEDRDPCEKETVTHFTGLHHDRQVIAETMEDGDGTQYLCNSSKELLRFVSMMNLLVYQCATEIKPIPKQQVTESKPWCRIR